MMAFELLKTEGGARRGRLTLPHGPVETPAFMPVGTYGTVKAMTPEELKDLGAHIILGNTFHLMLRPGTEVIAAHGGLHGFMHWDRPILTDSGGFQVFSLGEGSREGGKGALAKISEEGVEFRSHLDGSRHLLTPERSIAIQEALAADVIMAFDECPPALADRAYHLASLERTQRWLVRCKEAWHPDGASSLFGICQGGLFADLRRRAVEEAAALDLPGYALGGYAVGEEPAEMWAGVRRDAPLLPPGKPRYLMGVGTPEDLLACVAAGVDMFDCVLPTRCARNGLLFTSQGRLTIRNAAFQDDGRPADPACGCYTCRTFSRAYLRHLFRSGELTGLRLNTLHNIQYFLDLMAGARTAIEQGRFEAYRRERVDGWRAGPL